MIKGPGIKRGGCYDMYPKCGLKNGYIEGDFIEIFHYDGDEWKEISMNKLK